MDPKDENNQDDNQNGTDGSPDIDQELAAKVDEILAEDTAETEIEGKGPMVSKESFLKRVSSLTARVRRQENTINELRQKMADSANADLEAKGESEKLATSLRTQRDEARTEVKELKLKIARLMIGVDKGLPIKVANKLLTGNTDEEILLEVEELLPIIRQREGTIITDGARGGGVRQNGGNVSQDDLLSIKRKRVHYGS